MDENIIRSAIEDGMNNSTANTDKEVWKLAIELWKIEKKMQKCKEKLSEEENKSFEFLFNRVNQILWNNNVKVTDFSNQKWNEWMALLDIVSVEEDEWLEFPVIWETISPLVEINWKIVQRSKVIIYKPVEKKDKEPETIEELIEKKSKKGLRICLIALLMIIACIIWITLFRCWNDNKDINRKEQSITWSNKVQIKNKSVMTEKKSDNNIESEQINNKDIDKTPETINVKVDNQLINTWEAFMENESENNNENSENNNEVPKNQPNTESGNNVK